MRKNLWKGMVALAVLIACFLCGTAFAAPENAKSLDVLFVHDTHSHLNEFATVENGESRILGGFSKLKTLINEKRAENPETLILDAGDFSMGTLIQVVFEEEASEIDVTFTTLMGDKVEPRREFIEANAKYVKNLDV